MLFGSAITPMLVIVALAVRPLQCEPKSRYFCDTPEKIDEIRNIDQNLRHLFRYNDRLYFVLKNRVIYSKLNSSIVEKPDRLFLSLAFYEISQQDRPEDIDYNYRVFGYVHERRNGSKLWQYYALRRPENAGRIDMISDQANQLEFDENILRRGEMTAANAKIVYKLREIAAKKEDLRYFNLVQAQGAFTFMAHFGVGNNVSQTSGRSTNTLFLDFSWFLAGPRYGLFRPRELQGQPEWNHFAIYPVNAPSVRPRKLLYFVGIDREFRITFTRYEFTLDSQMINSSMFDFEELLNCRSWQSDRIRGIYYSRSVKRFFLFIRRFFVAIDEDLVASQFLLNDLSKHYQPVPIGFEEFPLNAGSSIGGSVKTLGQSALYGYANHFYQLTANERKLTLTNSSLGAEFAEFQCSEQTLVVKSSFVFCFGSEHYHFLYEMQNHTNQKNNSARPVGRWPIKAIFEKSQVQWIAQSLRHIFNYENDTVVFLTDSSLFILDYSAFVLSSIETVQIVYNSNQTVVQLKNYLYTKSGPLHSTSSSIGEHLLSVSLLLAGILAILFLVIWAKHTKRWDSQEKKLALPNQMSSVRLNSLEVMLREESSHSSSRVSNSGHPKRVFKPADKKSGIELKDKLKTASLIRLCSRNSANLLSKDSGGLLKSRSSRGVVRLTGSISKKDPPGESGPFCAKKFADSKSGFLSKKSSSVQPSYSIDPKSGYSTFKINGLTRSNFGFGKMHADDFQSVDVALPKKPVESNRSGIL